MYLVGLHIHYKMIHGPYSIKPWNIFIMSCISRIMQLATRSICDSFPLLIPLNDSQSLFASICRFTANFSPTWNTSAWNLSLSALNEFSPRCRTELGIIIITIIIISASTRSGVLLQKLALRQLVELPAPYRTQIFITVFTRVRHLSLHWASWTQHTALYPL